MKANEARKKAELKLTSDNDSQYSEIMADISKAVEAGKFECYVYDVYIQEPVREKLILLGYKVHPTSSFRNETTTKITW